MLHSPSMIRLNSSVFPPGDIALRILNHAKDKYADRKIHVQMLDINPEMLEEGKKRFARTMYHDGELPDSSLYFLANRTDTLL